MNSYSSLKKKLVLIAVLLSSFCKFCEAYFPLSIRKLRNLQVEVSSSTGWPNNRLKSNDFYHSATTIRHNHKEPLSWTTEGHRRPLHFVLKVGDLRSNLKFFEQFGYTLFRHEVRKYTNTMPYVIFKRFNLNIYIVFSLHSPYIQEFEKGCEATCNGPYGGIRFIHTRTEIIKSYH